MDGKNVSHICHEKGCINIDHLSLESTAGNNKTENRFRIRARVCFFTAFQKCVIENLPSTMPMFNPMTCC